MPLGDRLQLHSAVDQTRGTKYSPRMNYREKDIALLAQVCEGLELPTDDNARERIHAAVDAMLEVPADRHMGEEARSLRGRVLEKLVIDAIESAQGFVDHDPRLLAVWAFRVAVVFAAREDGMVTVAEPGFTSGHDTGRHYRVSFEHGVGPATMDVAIWWKDEADPDQPHGRSAVLIKYNDDDTPAQMRKVVAQTLAADGWDVRIVSWRGVEANPVAAARSLFKRPAPPTPLRPADPEYN